MSSLGFWSGRTGGVAWTGVNGHPSTGGATDSTFTSETYGAFVDRGQNVRFDADLFEFNELDGLHIHRYSTGTTITFSSASRNGGNGFLIGRATQSTLLRADVAENNEDNGFMIDGRPLVSGASASGSGIAPGSGAKITGSAAIDNERTGILVEGGSGTVLTSNAICAHDTGIAARLGTKNIVITGNDIRCRPRSGLSVGPGAPGAVISGNAVSDARIAILVRNSGRIEVDNNLLTGATVFGITARGPELGRVSGVGNVISGTGFRAVDARADARTPQPVRHERRAAGSITRSSRSCLTWPSTRWPRSGSASSCSCSCATCGRGASGCRSHPYPVSTHWRPAPPPDPEPAYAANGAGHAGHAGQEHAPYISGTSPPEVSPLPQVMD